MHVCAINGSLRGSRGATHRALARLGRGVESAGGSWDLIELAELTIERCKACGHCQKSASLPCALDRRGDVPRVFERMAKADLLVYASPVYVFGMSSLLEALLERLHSRAPVEGALLLSRSGLFFQATDRALMGKPFLSLVVCDNVEDLTVRSTRDYFRIFSRFMDAREVGHLELAARRRGSSRSTERAGRSAGWRRASWPPTSGPVPSWSAGAGSLPGRRGPWSDPSSGSPSWWAPPATSPRCGQPSTRSSAGDPRRAASRSRRSRPPRPGGHLDVPVLGGPTARRGGACSACPGQRSGAGPIGSASRGRLMTRQGSPGCRRVQ